MVKKQEKPEIFVYLPQAREIALPFRLDAVGTVTTPPALDYDIADHGHLEFCLRLSSSEELAHDELDGAHYTSTFPHLFVKAPHCRHRYRVQGRRNAIFFIYPSGTATVFEAAGMAMTPAALPFEMTPELRHLLDEFDVLFHKSQERGVADRFDLHCLQILENIYLQQPKPSERQYEPLIREIASYFQVNLDLPLTADGVCAKFGISRRNFFRYWKQYYNVSPAAYLAELRMREAERLLTTRHWQVQEIARLLGFDNTAYFIQAFRRRYGVTPGEFRLQEGALR